MRCLTAAVVLIAGACGGSGAPAQPAPVTISVFAAASLTDSFKAIGDGYHQQHSNVTLQFNFAGTPTLVTQIEQGAQADVFASADTTNMDRLRGDGFTSGTPQVFAHNKLEVAVAPGNPKHITSLADLGQAGLVYISAGPTVPAGKYAAQALQKAGVSVTPKSLETDVKSVISKIELGEADAGIVYTTDVKAASGKVDGVAIPDAYNVVATYPLVAVKDSKHADMANAFIAYVVSATGQSKLESFGFLHA
ncbi:MAG TPA: molybdate ABC transporter substrate-binding protein [Candidatus Dormibacteraeota bacterium]|nr:molybdate ABC transporter substrate-binding protein [Candidatus Dormibacteraeota bacterium]